MANESFSFEEAIGLTPKPQPSGAADPGGFSFEEALGKPAQASPGFIPTIKRTGGQMLTTAATAAEDVVGPNAVTRAVHEAGQGIIDRNPAGIRSLRDLVDSPWLAVKESVGQFAPQIAAAAAGGAVGAKAGAALGSVAGPAGAATGGAIGGVAGSLLPIFTQEYGGIRQEQKESGQEDKVRALAAAIPATALERVGMGKALSVLKGVPGGAAGTILKEAGKGVLKEGATEGAQNVIEQWGAFKDPTTAENLEDTALSAAMGGIGGGVMGAGAGAVDGMRHRAQERADLQASQAAADAQAQQSVDGQAGAPATPDAPVDAGAPGAPAINPADGPLSKAASMAGDLGLAPVSPAPTEQDRRAQLEATIGRLPEDAQREARLELADADNEALPAGVRAMRGARVQELVDGAPEEQAELTPEDMERGRVLHTFTPRNPLPDVSSYASRINQAERPELRTRLEGLLADARDESLAPTARIRAADELHRTLSPEAWERRQAWEATPDTRLDLESAAPARADGIDFTAPLAVSPAPDAMAERINQLALDADLTPGQALQLNQAHALRRRAAEQGITMSVIPHASGRGYDVAPTTRLDPAARQAMPQEEAAAQLPYDQSITGRLVAAPDGRVRAETRAEAVARGNTAAEQRQEVEAERQRRTELGLSNITPVVPVRDGSASFAAPLTFDNAPTGRLVAGSDGVRQERRADVVNRANQPAPVPQTVVSASGAPFATRQAAQQAQQLQQLASTHEVVPAGGDESLGFVLQENGRNQSPALDGKAQEATESVADRVPNWRSNALQANRVARGLGIDPKGKRLAQVVAEIDAADAQRAGVRQDGADLAAWQIDREWSAFAPETGTLGVPRAEMPQIKAEHRGALVNFLKARGIDSRAGEVPANDLKPTQAEFSPGKVAKARSFQGGDRSILVSSDGYVVDGHHQWLAKRANGEPVKVIRLQAPIRQVLAQTAEFPSSMRSDGVLITKSTATTRAGDIARGLRDQIDNVAAQEKRPGMYRQEAQRLRQAAHGMGGAGEVRGTFADAADMLEAWAGQGGMDSTTLRSSGVATPTASSTVSAPELVAVGADVSGAEDESTSLQGGGQQQDRAARPGPRQESAENQAPTLDQQAPVATKSGAKSAAAGPRPARAAAPRPTARIDDFGETLHGARKMLYAEAYADGMAKAKELDTKAHPLSKTWPEPDYLKLLDGGAPVEAVSMARALRDAVPTKPQSSWKLKGWAAKVEALRGFAEDVLSGRLDTKTVEGSMERSGMRGVPSKAALYEAVGHERSLKGLDLSAGHYSMYNGVRYDPARTIWTVERKAKGSTFGNWPRELAKGDTREAAIAAFKKRAAELLAEEQAPTKGATFEIYSKRAGGAREFFIGKKIGRNVAELKAGFADLKAARQYKADHQSELEDLLAKHKAVPPVRNTQNAPRIGEDYRKGADVTPERFQEVFGFRGVQFGNYVEGGRRQQDLNRAFDALMDLAGVLGLPPRALSLGGRLGLAFGARGTGGTDAAAAHYEPDTVVINLTKREGAGSLAHEWWHGLDNYFGKQRDARGEYGNPSTYLTETAAMKDAHHGGMRAEMMAAFRNVVSAINLTGMQERSRKLDDRRTKEYWTTKPEMSARAFESYVIAKLQDQNAGNDYLANVVGDAVFALEGVYPYPTAGELPQIRAAFDAFFQTVETREGEGGAVVLYNTSDEAPPARGLSLEEAKQAVQQALTGLRNPPPIDVVLRAADLGQGIPDYVKGVRKPDGQLAVVARAHSSPLDVIETVFHELFHQGLRNIVSDRDYVQAMLDLAKRDARVHQYALQWKKEAPEAAEQREALRRLGYAGAELNARYEALAIEEGLAVVAEELRAQKQAGTKLGMRVRVLANWLASVAERMGMQGLADSIRKMTYNEAERFVLRAIENAGRAPLEQGGAAADSVTRYRSREGTPAARRVGDVLQSLSVTNLRQQAGFKAADYRGLALQFLGRRQLVDVYGDMLPELRRYSDLMARMDADKNEAGAGADKLAQDWAKLPDERALAELMHDSTLAQIDPTKDFVEGDNKTDWTRLRARHQGLSPAAKEVFARARDTYRQHMRDVRSAIKERIERAEMSSERRAALLKRMDDEFFGHIKGVYFPLARFGQYVVVVKGADGKVENVSRAETMAEADTTRRQLLAAFPPGKGFTVGKVLKAKDFVAERDTVGRGFMEQLYGVLDKQGMDAKQRAELEDALGQLYLSSLPDLSWAKHGIHRKGTAGFSQDARRAFAQNVFHGASYLAKLRYGDQLQDELGEMQRRVDGRATDPAFDSVKAQQVVDEMVKRHDAAMNPKTNALSTALTSLGFMFHLGLSPASAMVNLTQTALVAYPVMGARWGFAKSGAALLRASQEAARGRNDITASLTADEKAAFDEAVRSGVIDVTMAHDLAGIAQGEDRNVSHKLQPVMKAASFLFHHAEKFNRQVTFVAAYRLARETGADAKAAYAQAAQATYDGHFDYSANNRPRVMQGNVARVLLLFKQYGQNMVYTLARSAQQSLKGATPEARAQARKALAGLLTTHAMAAGVLGLPMVTTLLAAASMLGGDDDEPWDAKVALQNLLADTFGQKPAEVLAHGLSRLTPWDISGRVGLDKLIFPDVQEGLEGQRLGESAMTAALGPVAAIGINVLKGLQEMSEGRYQRGLETMAPSVARGPLKAIRYGSEGVKDKSGIVVQDEVDAAALWGQAAGFSPSSVRNAYEGKSAIVGHDRALQARRSALVEQFAMAAMAKDEEGKVEVREAIAKFNEKNPNRRIQPMQLAQSVHQREKRIREAQDGVYLPAKRRDAVEQGRFAIQD